MGNCCSQRDDQEKEAAQRSAQIDRQIEQDGKKLKKECKILLLGTSALSFRSQTPYLGDLGSSESGKSTIVKQMCIIHQDGFSYDTKITYREAIYSNLLESAQAVATAMHKFKVEPADPSNVVSSSDLGSLVCFFNPTPCSQRWNEC
jgi:guanine nucleotide-binding protein subunit alpha